LNPTLVPSHEIQQFDSQENRQNCCHQRSDFKAKMHQIRLRLGLRPTPRWGSLQRSPRPPSWILGALLLREGRGKGREEKVGGEGGNGKGEGGHPPRVG